MPARRRLPLVLLRRSVVGIAAVAGIGGVVVTLLVALGLCRVLVVASGSMAPALGEGDLLVSRPVAAGELRPGQVITFSDASRHGTLVTHRVVSVLARDGRLEVVTRGDANTGTERWDTDPAAPVGLLAARVPHAGVLLERTAPGGSPKGLLGIPVLVAGALALRRIWAEPRATPRRRSGRRSWVLTGLGGLGLAGLVVSLTAAAFSSVVTNASSLSSVAGFAPSGASADSGLDAQVPLSWGSLPWASEYQVQWRPNGNGAWSTSSWSSSTASTITGLTDNVTYEFQVRARNADGTGPWSGSVLGTPRQWKSLSAGSTHTCAVTVSGRAYCWGSNGYGELGDGTSGVDRLVPVPVDTTTGLTETNVASISAGWYHSCAVTTAGQAFCWGWNALAQLGDGDTSTQLTPTPVATTNGLTATNVASVSAGTYETCAVTTGGAAYCWGYSAYGGLGNPGAGMMSSSPVAVDTSTGLTSTNVAEIGTGFFHACALTTDGRVYCWGDNITGALGIGSYSVSVATPSAVDTGTGLPASGLASLTVGQYHVCALTAAGRPWCWGMDSSGQLGDAGSATQYSPVAVTTSTGLPAVTEIRAGGDSTCAVTAGGAVWCWGGNSSGQLGDGTTTDRPTPSQVAAAAGLDGTNAVHVAVGYDLACAVTAPPAGSLSCWGMNGNGQVGDGSVTARSTATAVSSTAIPASVPAVPVILTAGNDGNRSVPLTYTGVSGATDYQARFRPAGSNGPWTISLQSSAGNSLTASPMTNGTLYELQLRAHNAAGFGDWSSSVTATPLGPPTGITADSGLETQVPVSWTAEPGASDYEVQWRQGSGSWTSAGWTTGTSVSVTGLANDTSYEFQVRARDANGTTAWSYSLFATPRRWAQLSAGYDHACAVTTSHRAYCWGADDQGQVGDGTSGLDRTRPVPVDTSTGLTASNVASISAGTSFTCAVTTTGKAYCWGRNDQGQVGDASTTTRTLPTAVDTGSGLSDVNVAAISAGQYHACAVTTDHRAYCWGGNGSGQLGDGTTAERHVPVAVDTSTGLGGVAASISAGGAHTCAVTTDSRGYCWGSNAVGQLGDGTTTDRTVPTGIASNGYFYPQGGAYGANVNVISAGQFHTCAVSTWSQVFCWGSNSNGQLGDGTTTNHAVPTAIDPSTSGGTANGISAGSWHTCDVTGAGQVFCWGANASGQLGDGTTNDRLVPAAVDASTGLATTGAASVSAGGAWTCAVTTVAAGGTGYCWGANPHGQLGDSSTSDRLSPNPLAATAIPALPADATGLAPESGHASQVPLTWPAVAGAEDYQVRWRTYPSGAWTTLPSTTGTTATISGLTDRVGYEFGVRAHDAAGFSAWTSATGSPGAPDVPIGVTADSGLDAQVRVSWTAVVGADEHQVQWRTYGSGSAWTSTAWTSSPSASVTGLTNGVMYEFQVRTRNWGGTTGWSGSATAMPRPWAQMSVGSTHACAVTVSGRAYCWGHNDAGQLGDGTYGVDRLGPVPVDTSTGLTTSNVASIEAGSELWDGNSSHTCAITTAGKLYCWGHNGYGELGDGTYTNQLTPVPVDTSSGLVTVKQVVGANGWTCAVSTGGQAFCWGHDWWGELGNASWASGSQPQPVDTTTGLTTTNVASISAYGTHTCAVTTGGAAYCWGADSNGALGNGAGGSSAVPSAVDTTTGLTSTNVAQVTVGWMHTCAVTTGGQGYCWGDNETAQGGHGYWSDSAHSQQSPTPVDTSTGLVNIASIQAGYWRTCAVSTGGNAYCWGGNALLGDGTGNGYSSPQPISTSTGVAPGSVVSVDPDGAGATCVLTSVASGGGVFCWGPGGSTGDGTTNQQVSPTAVATTPIPDPPASAPVNLAATSGQSTQVPLTWDPVAGASDYQVRWRTGAGAWTVASSTTGTSTTVGSLNAGTSYEFQVRAHDAGGFSAWTSSVTATP